MDDYLNKPEEVLNMFSEALRILDRNTVQYMIEEQLDQIMEQSERIEEQQKQLDSQKEQLSQKDEQLTQKDEQIENQLREIARLQKLLGGGA
ncbi:MAG: hypothetical protein HFI41_09890 [Lachnospiraceae bacterium]|nr:hypothetical protein [Lachnospiraceae bacterium]